MLRFIRPNPASYLLAALACIGLAGCDSADENTGDTGMNAAAIGEAALRQIEPPRAERIPNVLEAHGDQRTDYYYWLRDDERKNPRVLAYLEAENDYLQQVMAGTEELQERLYRELIARIPPNDESVPFRYHGQWFARRYREGLELPIHVRWRRGEEQPEGEPEVLLDENRLKGDFDYYSIGEYDVSPDGRWLAWTEDTVSRGIHRLRFRDLEGDRTPPERIAQVSGNVSFANDNRTVFYLKLQEDTLIPYQVWRHRLGTPAEQDQLVYEEQDSAFQNSIRRSRDNRWIVIEQQSTTTSEISIIPAADPGQPPRVLVPRRDGHEYRADFLGDHVYLLTNDGAKNFRIVRAPVADAADSDHWVEILPQQKDALIENFVVFERYLVAQITENANSKLTVLDLEQGARRDIAMDEPAYVAEIGTNLVTGTTRFVYTYESPVTPRSWYEEDLATGERRLLKRSFAGDDFDPSAYRVRRISITARDGTAVPVTLLHQRGAKPDGSHPALLLGYGSYGYSYDPGFFSHVLSLVDRGFVFALAHIRGGQEKGRNWYEQGRLLHKKNTFTDYIDAAKALIEQGWSHPEKLVGTGRSAGGLLMGVVANMAPELFHTLVVGVPFVDVVTTMLDESIPLTTYEYDEWGNPNRREFYDYMLSYSPYDNISAQEYPNIYVGTGLWDPAVQYWEPAKWVAKLRHHKTDDNLLVMYTDMQAGHRGGSGRFERQRDYAREFAFVLDRLGMAAERGM